MSADIRLVSATSPYFYTLVGHKLKRDGSKLLRSLSVAAAFAFDDQNVESEDDMTEGNSKSQVEGDKTEELQEQYVYHVKRFLYIVVSLRAGA